MLAFILRRLLLTLPVVWVVVSLVFGLIHMVPGDPVAQMLGESASSARVEGLRHELGLDRPVLDQYRIRRWRIVSKGRGSIPLETMSWDVIFSHAYYWGPALVCGLVLPSFCFPD